MDPPLETIETACTHCGAEKRTVLWSGTEHEYSNTTEAVFDFVRCAVCGVVRLDPRPAVTELSRIYPPDYYAYNLTGGDDQSIDRSLTNRLKMRMYQRRVLNQTSRLGKSGSIRMLDVGCGDGRLLDWYKASSVGPRLTTHGIEMSATAAAVARKRGHHVVTGRFEVDEQLQPGTFDLILASHVIEHVDDPLRFAMRAAELLAPGGLFVVGTPNWNSFDARVFRGHWGGNHFPRHWTLYDEASIGDLARRVDLSLERVIYQPNPIFWIWTCHSWLTARFPRRSWPDRVFPPVGIFEPSALSLVLQSGFTLIDLLQRALFGKTASMSAELRKAPA